MDKEEVKLSQLLFYFLKLGATVFGGALASLTHIRKELVDQRRWVTKEDFVVGLSLAQFTPGPLSTQVIMFLGWVKGGVKGATLACIAYILPAFVMVTVAAMFYVRFSGITGLQSFSYGVSAAVIAIIAQNAFQLSRRMLRKDILLWSIAAVNAVLMLWLQAGVIVAFILSGLFVLGLRTFFHKETIAISFLPPVWWLFSGVQGQISSESLTQMAWFFTKAGAVVFGGGLAIIPYLHHGVVYEFQWLTERQFLDGVAIALMTPGPVLIAAAFIGYLIAGLGGAVIATVGTLLPCYLLIIMIAPYYQKIIQNLYVKNFVKGVSAAAIGALVGASLLLAQAALIDMPALLISALSLSLLIFFRLPGIALIFLAGGIGVVLKGS